MILIVEDQGLAKRLQLLSTKTGLRAGWRRSGQVVKAQAQHNARYKTGRLRQSVRYRSRENNALISAGNGMKDAPYAPVQHWGNYNNIQGDLFLQKAKIQKTYEVVGILDNELARLIRTL